MWCGAVYRFGRRYTAVESRRRRRRRGDPAYVAAKTHSMEGVAACYARCTKTNVIWLIGRLLFFLKIFFSISEKKIKKKLIFPLFLMYKILNFLFLFLFFSPSE